MTTELTLEEKTSYAAYRGKLDAAEKHFFDEAQPFFPCGFSITRRNPGHWDIYASRPAYQEEAHNATQPEHCHITVPGSKRCNERAFRIRGEPGNVLIYDERSNPHRPHPRADLTFKSVLAAMMWICEELMQEPNRD